MRFHGPSSPGGVAHSFKVLERALPLLGGAEPPERREVGVRTAFGGPGARDGFEYALRAVSEGRYRVTQALARADLGPTRARFVFVLTLRGRTVGLTLREGFVTEEFLALAGDDDRSEAEEAQLTRLKREMAELLMATPVEEVYDAEVEADPPTPQLGA